MIFPTLYPALRLKRQNFKSYKALPSKQKKKKLTYSNIEILHIRLFSDKWKEKIEKKIIY